MMVIGPQGSGKTTQAKILCRRLGLCLVYAGELLREFAQGKSGESQAVKKNVGEGRLVDDKIVSSLVRKRIAQPDCQVGFVVDGYPRTLDSVRLFDPGFDKVLHLKVPDEEVKKRLLERGREDDTP